MKYQAECMEIESDRSTLNLGLRFSNLNLKVHEVDEPKPLVELVTGVDSCAKVLDLRTDDACFCILPTTSQENISLRIQQKLVAAFCMENEIDFLEIDDVSEISATLAQFPTKQNNQVAIDDLDLGCILVCRADKQDTHGG